MPIPRGAVTRLERGLALLRFARVLRINRERIRLEDLLRTADLPLLFRKLCTDTLPCRTLCDGGAQCLRPLRRITVALRKCNRPREHPHGREVMMATGDVAGKGTGTRAAHSRTRRTLCGGAYVTTQFGGKVRYARRRAPGWHYAIARLVLLLTAAHKSRESGWGQGDGRWAMACTAPTLV